MRKVSSMEFRRQIKVIIQMANVGDGKQFVRQEEEIDKELMYKLRVSHISVKPFVNWAISSHWMSSPLTHPFKAHSIHIMKFCQALIVLLTTYSVYHTNIALTKTVPDRERLTKHCWDPKRFPDLSLCQYSRGLEQFYQACTRTGIRAIYRSWKFYRIQSTPHFKTTNSEQRLQISSRNWKLIKHRWTRTCHADSAPDKLNGSTTWRQEL